jgi:L-cysteine:1D-myo-inositol 2-amino-2-deoxy-alpha-D-glucopyranoside ligase
VLDTATGALVDPVAGDTVTLYVCGITPYDATHLGHAATAVAFDVLGRAWRDSGLAVRYASNVTDVDEPLLERAAATGVRWQDLAVEQTALYADDRSALGVVPPDVYLGVQEALPGVVEAVSSLLAAGAAYRVPTPDAVAPGAGGDVYADLAADPAFGTVAGLDAAAMRALFTEYGGDPDRPGQRQPVDPLLWRRERAGEPAWDAGELGRGRPGWHVECAVIARDGLGLPFDVLGGGRDLRFPHHEMSTSHARLLDDGHGARAYVHTGMVGLDGKKMSKSLGNLELVSRLRGDGVDARAIRLALLAHRYRDDWEWTCGHVPAAQARLDRWWRAVSGVGGPDATAMLAQVREALADDLDTPAALAAVDAWADASMAGTGDLVEGAPGIVARAVDALLGVRL